MRACRSVILILLLSLILTSCASKNTFVKPAYKNKSYNNPNLLINFQPKEDFLQNEHIFKDLGIELTSEEYISLFKDELQNEIHSESIFQNISYLKKNQIQDLKSKELVISKEKKVNIDIPQSSIQTNSKNQTFILYLEDSKISFEKEELETSAPGKHYTVSGDTEQYAKYNPSKLFNYFLILRTNYAIFDNNNADVVSYGQLMCKEKYTVPNTIENMMEDAINKIVTEILTDTPFADK